MIVVFLFLSPKAVNAQSCGGYIDCGMTVSAVQCANGGSCRPPNPPFDPGVPCADSSSCELRNVCDPGFFRKACSASCGGGCGMGTCSTDNQCRWVNPPPPPGCTGDGTCKPSSQSCCSGSSYSDGSCGSGIRCGTLSSPPGGGSCPCSNWCTSSCPGGYTQTNSCGGCSPGLVACIANSFCGGGGGGGGGIPKATCGQSCGSDSDCNNPSAAGVATACRGGVCVNLACWSSGGTTVPGANCDCNGQRQCGQTCGASVGIICGGSSSCSYVDSTGLNAVNWGSTTYCVGQDMNTKTNALNPTYARSPGVTSYRTTPNSNYQTLDCGGASTFGVACLAQVNASGTAIKTQGFTPAEIAATCACIPPDSINTTLKVGPGSGAPLDGATVNSYNLFTFGPYDTYGDWGIRSQTKMYSVTFTWGAVQGGYGGSGPTYQENGVSASSYDIEVVPEGSDCANPGAYCLYNTTIRYQTYTFAPKVTKYKARIRNYDARCNLAGPWTPWSHFTVTGFPPSGAVYLDDAFGSTYNNQSNACVTGGVFPPTANNKIGGKLEIVDAPGLLGHYYNIYNPGGGPTGGQTFTENGVTNFGGTARTRYDIGYPYNPDNYLAMGWETFHGTLGMPGMSDTGGSVIWTGKIRPTSTAGYSFGARLDHEDNGTIGLRITVGGVVVVNAFPLYWNGNGHDVPGGTQAPNPNGGIALQKGQVYDIKIEYYKGSYNSSLFLILGPYLFQQDADSIPGTNWTQQGAAPNLLMTKVQPGNATTVSVSEGGTNYPSSSVSSVAGGGGGVFRPGGNSPPTASYFSGEPLTGAGTLTLNPSDSKYSCTCPAGCTYSRVSAPIYGKDFYVTQTGAAWFQVIGGNLITNGSVQSKVPAGLKFGLDGPGGFPGNVLYGGSLTGLNTANISSKGWSAKSTYLGRTYDYNYFNSIIPGSVAFNNLGAVASQTDFDSGAPSDGYYWYKATGNSGNLVINSNIVITGNRKVILFVPGNLTLNGRINIQTKGQGFFMVVVGGSINVQANLNNGVNPAIEGIFISSGNFDTGVGNTTLYVRGNVVAYGGLSLKRSLLANNSVNSAEQFEFAPDLVMLFPADLNPNKLGWKEVVP